MAELSKDKITDLKDKIQAVVDDLMIPEQESRLGELKTETLEPDFWSNNKRAARIMSEIDGISEDISTAKDLINSITTLEELFDIATDAEKIKFQEDYGSIKSKFEKFRQIQFLSGKYDKSDAIMSIHAGQGGTEAQDWAEMLLRMYTRYAESKGWQVEIDHIVQGNEAGISTVTIIITGRFAFGLLKNEKGTHRLVRLSPFNAQNLRQTSFAGVEVIPVIEDDDEEIVIPDSKIEFKATRAGGPGGQGVNKTSSAVQIKHIPTGITVHSSERRSQAQNRESAMKILRAKLWEIEEEKRDKELSKIKGQHKQASWGNQIRNYILHPYKLVKDLRTGVESSDPDAILDGDLDEFINAGLRI
ncbi:peptide chain release factor 2 [Candidatus Dojkabacteria bacterium]|nr:peptide chain release factor 2 [Candidatus Dojkabacteria bacterium]